MTRVPVAAVALALLWPAFGRSEDKPNPLAVFRGSWVCIEQGGKKPGREVKLVVDKTGGYRMGGTGGESSDLATLGGQEGTLKVNADRGELDLVGGKLTLPAIYQFEGDKLKLLVGPRGTRPTSFDKLDGTFHVFVREREKDDKK
jgi:hypothetical protein